MGSNASEDAVEKYDPRVSVIHSKYAKFCMNFVICSIIFKFVTSLLFGILNISAKRISMTRTTVSHPSAYHRKISVQVREINRKEISKIVIDH